MKPARGLVTSGPRGVFVVAVYLAVLPLEPTPLAGAILDIPFTEAIKSVSRWGLRGRKMRWKVRGQGEDRGTAAAHYNATGG